MSGIPHSPKRGFVTVVAVLMVLAVLVFSLTRIYLSPVMARSSASSSQGECGWPFFRVIYAVDTLCCSNGTCADFLCENVFCDITPFGYYYCWQDLALCGVLYCPDNTIHLWRKWDRAYVCQVGPIITGTLGCTKSCSEYSVFTNCFPF